MYIILYQEALILAFDNSFLYSITFMNSQYTPENLKGIL